MTPERWAQIEEIFHRVVESHPQRRTSLLELTCGDDTELREQVQELLDFDNSAQGQVRAAIGAEFTHAAFALTGKIVSHYRILEGLDGGGMGVVYRAEDIRLGRQVAIKFLPEDSAKDSAALRRFEREARAASALEHPNICPLYEFGEHEGQPFLVMQLLEGRTLREVISTAGALDRDKLVSVAIQIAAGLEAAHRHGIIHRDIKPANIFLTHQGQAKLLDFGLAKLHDDSELGDQEAMRTKESSSPFLSRTGTAIGTAAYMSPEQMHGEKLDARTDVFSFGLVLREMAGQARTKTLDNRLSRKIGKIIGKCIEPDREARYQSASEIRADLEALRQDLEFRPSRWWAAGVGALVLFMLFGGFWLARRQRQSLTPAIRFQQLTANSYENRISGAQISPDGRSLLYTDRTGMHLKRIANAETQTIALPEQLRAESMELTLADYAWSRDGSRFLANAHPSGVEVALLSDVEARKRGGVSIWEFSIASGAFRKLRDSAWADSYSPDGSLIAFRTNKGRLGTHEIWLMESSGSNAHKILESGDESGIGVFRWSPDGKRVSYLRDNGSTLVETRHYWEGDHLGKEISQTEIFPKFLNGNEVLDGVELPDGRAIFAVQEHGANSRTGCNFWTVRIDQKTGGPLGKAQQLTHWPGVCMSQLSFTNDGKKLTFMQWAYGRTVNSAILELGGSRIGKERHLTLTESEDYPVGWTPDSKKIILVSNRSGHFEFYVQYLDKDAAEVLVDAAGYSCCVSPDGGWFIYLTPAKSDTNSALRVMRAPIGGGASQEILTAKNLVDSSCARFPSTRCIIAERTADQKQVVITSFDVLKGRGSELTRISVDPDAETGSIKISPDGRHLAVIRNVARPLQILSLTGELIREIKIPTWDHDTGPITWATNSQSLYVPASAPAGASILHVSLSETVQVLRMNGGGPYISAIPSPDGRHIAIGTSFKTENVWMMENF